MGKKNSSLLDNDYFLMIGSFVVGFVVSRLMSPRKVISGDIKEGMSEAADAGIGAASWAGLVILGVVVWMFAPAKWKQ